MSDVPLKICGVLACENNSTNLCKMFSSKKDFDNSYPVITKLRITASFGKTKEEPLVFPSIVTTNLQTLSYHKYSFNASKSEITLNSPEKLLTFALISFNNSSTIGVNLMYYLILWILKFIII